MNIESYKEAALQSGIATTTAASPIGYIVAVAILSVVSASSISKFNLGNFVFKIHIINCGFFCNSSIIEVFIIWRFYYNKMTTSCEQLEQQQHHGNGQHNATEGSHGATDNHPTNHVKFSNLIENVTIEECPK